MAVKWILEWLRKKGILEWPIETRCHMCGEGTNCPAYDTGVIYPCPYYHQRRREALCISDSHN